MNRRTNVILIAFIFAVMGGVGLYVFSTSSRVAGNTCGDVSSVNHAVTIQDGKVLQGAVKGHLCDTLTFKNLDDITRAIAFGPHENHVPYDGVSEKFLNKGQSFTITLDEIGTYHWHDHLHDEVQGYFTVTK